MKRTVRGREDIARQRKREKGRKREKRKRNFLSPK